jgi:hypothetical protein
MRDSAESAAPAMGMVATPAAVHGGVTRLVASHAADTISDDGEEEIGDRAASEGGTARFPG